MRQVVSWLVLCLLSSSAWGVEPHYHDTIRLTNGEWPPYLSYDLQYYGFASRIVKEAFALEGIKVEYGFFPWKRAYLLAQQGKWDGSVVWHSTAERKKDFLFSDGVIKDYQVFFHLKSYAFDWNSLEDLTGILIGGTSGYVYNKEFDQAVRSGKLKIVYENSDEINLRKILWGRIKIFLADREVGFYLLNKHFTPAEIDLFTHHPKPLKIETLHLILSKKIPSNPSRLISFNKGLHRLKVSGKLDQFLNEWRQKKVSAASSDGMRPK
ncbi:MAG: transporter substrate-binding domain-containing protein [SAR324 cluster bacterium]|nr:transporter substrate-binding domain-containing protein [SAR324 cluster bacterium]